MEFQNEKDEIFDFLNKDRFLALDQDYFLWHGNENQLLTVIKTLPFFESSEGLVSFISFSNNNFIIADNETIRFFEELKKINYNKLAISALFCYLKIKYQQNKMSLDYCAWSEIIPILVNPKISDEILNFLIEMSIPFFLKITKTENEFMKAVRLHFFSIIIPNDYSWNLCGFSNLLKFLRVEESRTNALIEKTRNQKSFDQLRDFLSNYKLNF